MTSGQTNTNRALLATCVAAAARAAEIIRGTTERRGTLRWESKTPGDYVSEVDRAAEAAIGELIHERHADARLLAEEMSSSTDTRAGLVFVADPLDGTTNFLHGFPWYAVSIAAMIDNELAAAAIINVPNGELFTATKGGGARKNGQPISVSSIDEPIRSLVATGFPFRDGAPVEEYLRTLPEIMRQTSGVRRPGAAALDLADVACGRFEAFWEMSLNPWDIAAGVLLVREAGGIVTTMTGEAIAIAPTSLVAGNPAMHEWLLGVVSEGGRGNREEG
ncbi:MAG TPA: inositol monophosphatase family protein [Gemmatimonadaceae bacterium]|nr:inositol monophosphatase family protein [Gemmatimonadaceae bacterium]